jgi:Domain of unknown function (DUF1996)
MRRILMSIMIIALVPITARAASQQVDPSSGWIVACNFSHRATNDPIVHARMPGMSHSHDFFGNDTTDAMSTASSLLGKSTSCSLGSDTAAYWVPSLYKNGNVVKPIKATIYYRTQVDGGVTVQPFPTGLKMIAGDQMAAGPQSEKIVYYNCHDGPDQHRAALPYDCGTHTIDAHIRFPQCWDGVHLDSADHTSHMAYPVYDHGVRSCPASHPVVVPRLIIRISWPITNGNRVRLASGQPYTLHADYLDAWQPSALQNLVDQCINAGRNCGKQKGPGF